VLLSASERARNTPLLCRVAPDELGCTGKKATRSTFTAARLICSIESHAPNIWTVGRQAETLWIIDVTGPASQDDWIRQVQVTESFDRDGRSAYNEGCH